MFVFQNDKQHPKHYPKNSIIMPNNSIITAETTQLNNSSIAFFIVGILLEVKDEGLTISEIHERITSWGGNFAFIGRQAIENAIKHFPNSTFSKLELTWLPKRIGKKRIPSKSYFITFKP